MKFNGQQYFSCSDYNTPLTKLKTDDSNTSQEKNKGFIRLISDACAITVNMD